MDKADARQKAKESLKSTTQDHRSWDHGNAFGGLRLHNVEGSIQEAINLQVEVSEDSPELLECCKRTIAMHAKNNPMMVCSECKKIIKVFDNDKAYRNYQRFCASRHRRFLATHFAERHVVVFKNYDGYTA